MTKVQITLNLSRALNDDDLKQILKTHTVYGVFTTRVANAGQALFVEYDASRMSREEVREMLREHGLPVS